MYLSIDFGGSTLDVIWWKENAGSLPTFLKVRSFERHHFEIGFDFKDFLKTSAISLRNITEIFVTGGKSRFFPSQFQNIPVISVSEIEAIGRGGWYLLQHEKKTQNFRDLKNLLVVSMGTGTCMVEFEQKDRNYVQSRHVGGTGIGGGTFLGLCKSLLHETDIEVLKKLFQNGDKRKVDLSVEDIIGSGLGKIPPSATASHLAKLSNEIDFSKADLASGIVNLIGQTIGIIATFAAQERQASLVLLTGKLTRIEKILQIILETAQIYGVAMVVPEKAPFVTALGAGMKV